MAELTQERVHELFEYRDGKLYYRDTPKTPNHVKKGAEAGWIHDRKSGRRAVIISNKKYFIHRVVFLYFYGYLPTLPDMVDHIDRDCTNNRIDNLRVLTHGQNCANTLQRSGSISGYKGVTPSAHGTWIAQMREKGVLLHFGCRSTAIEAAKLYDENCLRIRGDLAVLNFPQKDEEKN